MFQVGLGRKVAAATPAVHSGIVKRLPRRSCGLQGGDSLSQLLELDLAEGGSILIEVAEPSGGPVTRGGRPVEAVTKAGESLEHVLSRVGPAVRGIVSELRSAVDSPDQFEIEFAIKLSTDANVIIARAGGEANFKVALRWSRQEG